MPKKRIMRSQKAVNRRVKKFKTGTPKTQAKMLYKARKKTAKREYKSKKRKK